MTRLAAFTDETARFAEDLLGLMTLEEKLGQLDLFHPAGDPALESEIAAGRVGGVLGSPEVRRWQTLATSRARRGIPLLLVAPASRSALSPYALAAGWSVELAREQGALAAHEARGAGYNTLQAPQIAWQGQAKDVQIASSDPRLAAELADAWLEGALETGGMIALAAAQEAGGAAVLALTHQLARRGAAVGIDVAGLTPRTAQAAGFGGILIREASAIRAAALQRYATTRARSLGEAAETAIAAGVLDEARIDAVVRRVLAAKHAAGLFRDPLGSAQTAAPTIAPAVHRRRTMVLLRNEAGLLPLSPVSDRVLVVGPGQGAAKACVEALARAGIGRLCAPGLALRREGESWTEPHSGDPFALALTRDAARRADFAFVVLDDRYFVAPRGASWPKPGRAALALLTALAPVGTRLVAVLATRTPVDLGEADAHFAAVLQAWDEGEGFEEALGDMLSGRAGPSGHMPAAAGRYAFGLGLSYGESVFSGFTTSAGTDHVAAQLKVRNAGSFAARETVQLYRRDDSGEPALVAWREVALAPGEERMVVFELELDALALPAQDGRRELLPGPLELLAGKDQRRTLSAVVQITPALARGLALRRRGGLRLAG
ncbi:glycoside hydrolase family 3 C-terminal domain-containing protein [Qipengyuania sediminis]|uniref:glycoside hydrolase family 3 C-terminal domain-containing protein n=1 Tax=Qipengyuania sediminis TaxID=1532023 RepID=UPI0014047FD5|nr:glycoside hydrolase family 3 C-terminal domain-containing protein [Qipengyuania sediminis]